jgi:hypothetical protein
MRPKLAPTKGTSRIGSAFHQNITRIFQRQGFRRFGGPIIEEADCVLLFDAQPQDRQRLPSGGRGGEDWKARIDVAARSGCRNFARADSVGAM